VASEFHQRATKSKGQSKNKALARGLCVAQVPQNSLCCSVSVKILSAADWRIRSRPNERVALWLLGRIGLGQELGLRLVFACTSPVDFFIGPIVWGHSGPHCHALSLLLWTSMRRRRATVATPGECQYKTGGVRRLAVANGPNILQLLLVL